jgi:hypothetical protein
MSSPLHPNLRSILVQFYEAGGCGHLDMHQTVLCGSPPAPVPAARMGDWLTLMIKGCIAGENDKVLITEAGRIEAENILAGRTKTGA